MSDLAVPIQLSSDTLHFDTVFTNTTSITKTFKIYNKNNFKITLTRIAIENQNSFFKLNVDGAAGNAHSNIEILPNDSLYGFVILNASANNDLQPFVISDSVLLNINGTKTFLQLRALGRNADFLPTQTLTKDTTWTSTKPIVLTGNFIVSENATLTIQPGTRIFANANAALIISGSIMALGEPIAQNRIIFSGSRLDEPYKNFPGSWPGIFFGTHRKNQILNYCTIKNAYQGLIFQPLAVGNNAQVLLNGCELNNISDIGLGAVNSRITATNCLITNCGFNVYAIAGGNYRFQHCTIASIHNNYVEHKNPVFTVSNAGNGQLQNLQCFIENSIIYGEGNNTIENELSTQVANGANFQLQVSNSLVGNKRANTVIQFSNSLLNQSPLFDSINVGRRIFSFLLKPTSPCIDKGILLSGIPTDFVGKNRILGTLPDMGCYENK